MSVTITDSPMVVEMKKEFFILDEQEQSLKAQIKFGNPDQKQRDGIQLIHVRTRKAQIAKETC